MTSPEKKALMCLLEQKMNTRPILVFGEIWYLTSDKTEVETLDNVPKSMPVEVEVSEWK